jgi:glycerol-3-phosphate dehydrogenase
MISCSREKLLIEKVTDDLTMQLEKKMNEQVNTTESEKTAGANHAAAKPAENRQRPKVISSPREVAAVVMARMNMVNAKKDELIIAIKGLTDITQQLTQAYAGQVQRINQLTNRVKGPEEKAGANGVNRQVPAQVKHIA